MPRCSRLPNTISSYCCWPRDWPVLQRGAPARASGILHLLKRNIHSAAHCHHGRTRGGGSPRKRPRFDERGSRGRCRRRCGGCLRNFAKTACRTGGSSPPASTGKRLALVFFTSGLPPRGAAGALTHGSSLLPSIVAALRIAIQPIIRFCFECIMEWAGVESTCPLCRARFSTVMRTRCVANLAACDNARDDPCGCLVV